MSKVVLELDSRQIEKLVEKLPLEDRIHLAQRLNLGTWQVRFKSLISKIDKRLKNTKLPSNDKIVRIVKGVRKRSYAQSSN